ncbi:vWA domain-containing protein [Streptomyces sp. HPF1205]|uniref:vWA domain-containing protein n=1 Tax=Streptomyces sp. HPF1205 TaxID=2873262 RepID=UPI001CED2E67|nr:vWA domain-containing protein [Streptomyces sp. HPF1205]
MIGARTAAGRGRRRTGPTGPAGRGRIAGALAALALLLTALTVPTWVYAPKADAFGTVISPELGQHAEHEQITRAALACGAGKKSDGSCFEPDSLGQLAGHFGTFGAVGAPDWDETDVAEAHCDNADFLDVPGYPHDRTARDNAINGCIDHARARYDQGVTAAGQLLDSGDVLRGDQVDISLGCSFNVDGSGSRHNAKCDVIEDFGRALHTVQDFYSHSNYVDRSDPDEPIGPTNPPGLSQSAPSELMNLSDTGPKKIPPNLTTGYYKSFFTDFCTPLNTLVRHACMNKDKAIINVDTGVDPPTWSVSLGLLPQERTHRGVILDNEKRAVDAAVAETRQQWVDFRKSLSHQYGDARAHKMILAITQDVPKVDLVFAIDTTGSMAPYIDQVVSNADALLDDLSAGGNVPFVRLTDYRVGVVDYKDVDSPDPDSCPPDPYDATTDLPFSNSHSDIVDALDTLPGKVGGGCDIPEDMLSGIKRAVDFPWRNGGSKSIIVMGDAPGHDPEAHSGLTQQSVIDAAKAVDPASVYPILVGGDPSATAFETALAEGTGGKVFDSDTAGGVAQALVDAITAIAAAPPTGDVAAPTVTVHLPTPPDAQGGVFNASQAPVTGSVTATDESGVASLDCADNGGGLTLGPLTHDASGNAGRTLTVTGDGEHEISCQATDASPSANTGVGEGSDPVGTAVIDATSPTVACPASPALIQPADSRMVPVTTDVTVTDDASGPAGFTLTSVTGGPAGDVQDFDIGTADTSGELRAVPSAQYTLTYQGKDAAGNTATCTTRVVVTAGSGGAVAIDKAVSAVEKKSASPLVSPKLTTGHGGELLLAYVSADGPADGTQQVTRVTGGGLTWTRAARSNAKGIGTAEVWQAYATSPVTSASVTASLARRGYDGAITVVAYTGAASTVGATAHASGRGGTPSATVTTTVPGALVQAAGHDWSSALRLTPKSGQRILVQYADTRMDDTYWVQGAGPVVAAGTHVTIGLTQPLPDRWGLAAVEVRPALS